MKRIFLAIVLLLLLPSLVLAEELKRSGEKLDSLLVYGQGFIFSVKEPSGWVADIENAKKFSANIIFYPASKNYETAQTVIRVFIVKKVDENTQEDLAHDMNGYRAQYPNVNFTDIAAPHPTYRVYPKLFAVQNVFYEYVAYINPGPEKKLMFSTSMNKQKEAATQSELGVYQEIIASLLLL